MSDKEGENDGTAVDVDVSKSGVMIIVEPADNEVLTASLFHFLDFLCMNFHYIALRPLLFALELATDV